MGKKHEGCAHEFYGQCCGPCDGCHLHHEPNELTKKTLEESERGEDLHEAEDVEELIKQMATPTPEEERDWFIAYLEEVVRITADWPDWKRNILGHRIRVPGAKDARR